MLCLSTPAAPVGLHFRPSRRQRRRCVDLVHHAVPNASFDAVLQRRQHAVRPDGGFDPRPVAGFCALFSNLHWRRFPCLVHSFRTLPSCPALAREGFASPPSHVASRHRSPRLRLRRIATMRAVTPLRLTLPQRSLRLLRLAFRASRSQPLDGHAHRFDRHLSLSVSQGFALQSQARRTIPPKRIRYPTGYAFASSCSPPRLRSRMVQIPPPRALTTQLLSASHGMAPRGGDSITASARARSPKVIGQNQQSQHDAVANLESRDDPEPPARRLGRLVSFDDDPVANGSQYLRQNSTFKKSPCTMPLCQRSCLLPHMGCFRSSAPCGSSAHDLSERHPLRSAVACAGRWRVTRKAGRSAAEQGAKRP